MSDPVLPITIRTLEEKRLFRVGAVTVLEVAVAYPCLCRSEGELTLAQRRFNEGYRRMAEVFLDWAAGTPAAEAVAALERMGRGERCLFDRRLLSFTAEAEESTAGRGGRLLLIRRRVRATTRRGGTPVGEVTALDAWRVPELTLCPPRRG
jgi:hypothetical protein